MELDAFIESHVRSLRSEKAARPPNPAGCLAITKLAKHSIASRAGLARNDLLSLVDRSPASKRPRNLYDDRASKRLFTFYSRARQELVELATTGIEIGVALDHTAEAIRVRFDPKAPDPSALERLWELGDTRALLELSRKALAVGGGSEKTPALLFEGVGMWEAGEYAPGLQRVESYLTRFGRDWTMNFASIGIHYIALEQLRQGQREAGLERLQNAFEYFPLEATADVIAEITGVRPPLEVPVWTGRPFPVDYALPTIEGEKKTVALAPALSAMGGEQLFCVCLLATYRSNGPYFDFLNRYLNFATWFEPFLAGMHVITATPKRYENRAYHYEREDEVRALPPPFEILLEEGEVVAELAPSGSPFIVLLDREGEVVYEGDLETVDWWDTLARARG
jgi:hypothetical protein